MSGFLFLFFCFVTSVQLSLSRYRDQQHFVPGCKYVSGLKLHILTIGEDFRLLPHQGKLYFEVDLVPRAVL